MQARAGDFRMNLSGEAAYRSFIPTPLPPDPRLLLDGETVALLVSANKQVALLGSAAMSIPSVRLFVSTYVRKEALLSSQIEGTQATLEDILDPHVETNANRDIRDVINYVRATEFAVRRLKELPLCSRLLRETHAVLMEGVRGEEKDPGEFRRSQNWIGSTGSTLRNARYIPPAPQDMVAAMSDLEKYWNSGDALDVLVQAALIHYQFETIHPFLDGNGRIGRLLNTLFLMERGALTTPVLCISYFLKKNRIEYYDRLSEVRRSGDYEQWVKFFLRATQESAADATETVDRLVALHERNARVVESFGRAASTAVTLLTYLAEHPIIDVPQTAKALGVTFRTASAAIERFCEAGILVQTSGKRRNRLYTYEAYLALLRDGT